MAIKIDRRDNKRVLTTYHRIGVYSPTFIEGQQGVSVNLFGYVDEDARNEEKKTGESMVVTTTGIVLPLDPNDTYTRESLYTAIMAMPEFAGCTLA
jgi:hypothetical protein